MADQQQESWLSGSNRKQQQYLSYYQDILSQLMQNPNTVTAQVIAAPETVQAQTIEAPDKIQAERINVEQHTYGDYADEAAKYLSKYLDNSIAARRKQTSDARAAADVDAYSRGMGGSTWLTDAKNRLAEQEAADIMAAQNEFLGRVGEQAYNAMQAQYGRVLQADMQNAANQLTADQQNAYYENLVKQYNANAQMNVDMYNSDNLLQVAIQNAANALNADQFNANLLATLEQLAWQRAQEMYKLKRSGNGSAPQDNSGVEDNGVTAGITGNAGGYGGKPSGSGHVNETYLPY